MSEKQDEAEQRLIDALKFVKVKLDDRGYLTDVSVVMLMVEMKKKRLKVSLQRHLAAVSRS